MAQASRRVRVLAGAALSTRAFAAAGLLMLVLGLPSCGPDLVFDNPCDRSSPAFDACACRECPALSACVPDADDQELGVTCQCGESNVWCVDQQVCCAASQVCHGVTKECCTPRCDGLQCGDDGCGGTCGTCEACGSTCVEGQCLFTFPACIDKACGDNGCGGSCGTCPTGQDCLEGQCVAG